MISIRRLLPILVAFLCVAPAIGQSATAPPQKSDRESAGLRGPVEACDVKTTIPPQKQGGATYKVSYVNKYDRDGRIYQRIEYNDSESFSYDAGGHLLRAISVAPDGTSDLIYTYDAQGRLIRVVGEKDWTTTFEYDDQGRKTRIVKSNLTSSPRSISQIYGGYIDGIEFNNDLSVLPPDGGLATTSFNEHDQAVETRVYDTNGDLTNRLSFTYDSKGRVAEYLVIETKLEFLPPSEVGEQLAVSPEVSDETKGDLAVRISYIYDDAGRVVEKHDYKGFSQEETITKIKYNDRGDETEEIATTTGDLSQPKELDDENGRKPSSDGPELGSATPEPNVVRFSYQYDSFGNWIERTVNLLHGADEARISTVTHRTVTYY